MSKNIILIGGAPTAGKSTMAHLVAGHLGLPWISTDQIREMMRLVANRNDYPKLFSPEGYTAERFLTEFSTAQIADMEMEQGEAVWPGIKKFILDDYTWRDGFIIEGVDILPHLIAKDFVNEKQIRPIFLIDEDRDRISDVLFTRGLWGDAHTYSVDLKEKEIEWVLLFNQRLKTEVGKFGYPLIEVKKHNDDLQAVLKALGI